MQRLATVLLVLAIGTIQGCSQDDDGLLRTEGRVLKGGQPFVPEEGEFIQIEFVPILPGGEPPPNFYVAVVDQTNGTFHPAGAELRGMPPGKYRVAVELMKNRNDELGGKFDAENSPFVVDVDATTEEIVIDLDQPPGGAQTASTGT
jgi:hypothetical protein